MTLGRLEDLWRGSFGREYTDRNAAVCDARASFWRDLLLGFSVESVLEVGCNVGLNLRWIAPLVRSQRVTGVDVNAYALAQLRTAMPAVPAAVAVARALPFRDGAFDVVLTVGVLIHLEPATLPAAMTEIVRCARRYVLCGEYFAPSLTEVVYRGQRGALYKQDYGTRYRELFPELTLRRHGRLTRNEGFDDVTYWLFEKTRTMGSRAGDPGVAR
jgi:pseudaminic acid biosynthesis-associated methylase